MKSNPMLDKLKAQYEIKYRVLFDRKMDMVMQLTYDSAFLAAADVFHMGPGRCVSFGTALKGYLEEIAAMMNEDQKDDKNYVYTREKVDARLKQICGDNFTPWEERYKVGETG